jgi:hypothetical protein
MAEISVIFTDNMHGFFRVILHTLLSVMVNDTFVARYLSPLN